MMEEDVKGAKGKGKEGRKRKGRHRSVAPLVVSDGPPKGIGEGSGVEGEGTRMCSEGKRLVRGGSVSS